MKTELSNQNGSEFGYGIYVNAVAENIIWASYCLPKNATPQEITAARRRVSSLGRYHYKKALKS